MRFLPNGRSASRQAAGHRLSDAAQPPGHLRAGELHPASQREMKAGRDPQQIPPGRVLRRTQGNTVQLPYTSRWASRMCGSRPGMR